MACLAVSLALLVAAVRLWPGPGEPDLAHVTFDTRGQEVIEIEEILPTQQGSPPPPPPVPAPPVVVPDDVVLEEVELDLADNLPVAEQPGADEGTGDGERDAGTADAAGPAVRSEVGPRTVRFVEPEYTQEARRRKVRAEVVVEVLVDERGQVRETKILERFLLGNDPQEKRPVDTVGYGLEEAALSAAERWIFRPARQNGRPVRSYTTLTFTFGV